MDQQPEQPKKKRSAKRQRHINFTIRLSPSENAVVQHRAAAQHVTVAAIFRMAVFALTRDELPPESLAPVPTPERIELATISAQLGKIGSNLNQLTKLANLGAFPDREYLEPTCAVVQTAARAVIEALGVKIKPQPQPKPEPVS